MGATGPWGSFAALMPALSYEISILIAFAEDPLAALQMHGDVLNSAVHTGNLLFTMLAISLCAGFLPLARN